MPNPKELQKIGNLFNTTASLSKSFLEKCSQTKFLAVKDYYQAEDEYIKLAEKTLNVRTLGIENRNDCFECLSTIKSELETGQLNQTLVDALEGLKATYLERILRPAVKQYIQDENSNNRDLKKAYTNALKIENLLEVVQFLNKVQRLE